MYQQMSTFLENVDNLRLLLITSAGQRYINLLNIGNALIRLRFVNGLSRSFLCRISGKVVPL